MNQNKTGIEETREKVAGPAEPQPDKSYLNKHYPKYEEIPIGVYLFKHEWDLIFRAISDYEYSLSHKGTDGPTKRLLKPLVGNLSRLIDESHYKVQFEWIKRLFGRIYYEGHGHTHSALMRAFNHADIANTQLLVPALFQIFDRPMFRRKVD